MRLTLSSCASLDFVLVLQREPARRQGEGGIGDQICPEKSRYILDYDCVSVNTIIRTRYCLQVSKLLLGQSK